MSSVSRRALFLSTVAVSLVLGGCGKEEAVDPYDTFGSLDQITRGFVRNEDFLFETDAPQFVYVKGNTGIAKVGNHLEVIVADDLENRAPTWDGKIIGVQKFFKPYVWLMAKRVKEKIGEEEFSIVELDSVTNPVLPKFTNVDLEEVSGFDLGSLEWNKKQQIDDMNGAEVQGVGEIVQMPDHQVELPAAAEDGTIPEPTMAWYVKAQGSDALFKITNVSPELEFTFGMLEAMNLPFIGGVKIGETYSFAERNKSKVSAPVEITFVRFANRYLAP